jgi:hypothetical protein
MKNLALAKFEAGDTAGSLTMLQQQAKDAFLGPIEGIHFSEVLCIVVLRREFILV